jgi:hypothetical protein
VGCVRKDWLMSLCSTKPKTLAGIFAPGNAGVLDNERADQLVDVATVDESIYMDRSDILNAFLLLCSQH